MIFWIGFWYYRCAIHVRHPFLIPFMLGFNRFFEDRLAVHIIDGDQGQMPSQAA